MVIYYTVHKCTINNTESLIAAGKEIGLEVNSDKTKYIVMSRDQNAGLRHNIKIESNSCERVEEYNYLGTTLTYQNSIQEEIKGRLKSGNACYHPAQNLFFFQFAIQKFNY